MTDLILQQRDGAILTLTLNEPERRNPISDVATVDALIAAVEAADADIEVRCVILTGCRQRLFERRRPEEDGARRGAAGCAARADAA